MAALSLITGADSRLFGNLCMLQQSLREADPAAVLYVCDFGFEPAHRRFFEDQGILLPKPDCLRGKTHPWYAKAAMGDFLLANPETNRNGGFVWIDADIVAVRPITAAIEMLAEDMRRSGEAVALCPDANGVDLDGFIAEWRQRGEDLSVFRRLLDAHEIPGGAPYLNTGLVIVTDRSAADAWRDLTLRQGEWLLFEQNCFNVLAHANAARTRLLPTAEWNAHGPMLDTVAQDEDDPVRLIHATSNGDRHVDGDIRYGVEGCMTMGNLKLFLREDLRTRQLSLLQRFLETFLDPLVKAGVLTR